MSMDLKLRNLACPSINFHRTHPPEINESPDTDSSQSGN
jgi:hypothetical protein